MTVYVPEYLTLNGYAHCREIPGRGWCALQRMAFTWGLFYGINEQTYDGRYCYRDFHEALDDVLTWDGTGDPNGDWIKHKGKGGEYSNTFNDLLMTKEEIIKSADQFEAELSALARKYKISTYSFLGFMGTTSAMHGYPTCISWEDHGGLSQPLTSTIMRRAFNVSVHALQNLTGAKIISERYEGFDNIPPKNDSYGR